jgi:protein-arginine kinase
MTKYKINKGFIVQKINQNTVIFDADKSELITFNETGGVIFSCLKKGWDKERTVKQMLNIFESTAKKLEHDYEEFVKKLLQKQIISPVSYVATKK